MDHEHLHKLLLHRTKKIANLAEAIAPDFDADDIHAFRVAVKKLRALLRLIDTDKAQPKLKLPKSFKKMYNVAGNIRDAELELKKISTWHHDLPIYRQHLLDIIESNKKQWTDHYTKDITAKLTHNLTDHKFSHLSPSLATAFFNKWMGAIRSIADATLQDDDIHAIRKHIKDLVYIASFAEKKWHKAYEKLKPFPLPALDELATLIGNYNDDRLMREHLLSFAKEALPFTETEYLKELTDSGGTILKEQRQKVLTEIRKLITAAPLL